MLRSKEVLFSVLFLLVLGSCAGRDDSIKSDSGAPPAPQAVASDKAESNPNFISAPNLAKAKVDKLWNIATGKCYDFGWAVANNDRSTGNILCQTTSGGDSMTMRIRFAQEGIYLNLTSSSGSWKLLGGDRFAAKTREHKEMKAALIAGLK